MKVLVFSGTTEGREISQFLADKGVSVTACVATEYGNMVMPANSRIEVRTGRLSEEQIAQMVADYSFVIDATHPYAELVTKNIKSACNSAGVEYIRLLRPSIAAGKVIEVNNTHEAVKYLNTVGCNILLTTGSKELDVFTGVSDYGTRIFARVLPTTEVVDKCTKLGFKGKNLICMQGPFSYEMNIATLKQTKAKYLVTKDTGSAGGFQEKISAAEALGVTVVLISRKAESDGITISHLKTVIMNRLGLYNQPQYGRFPLFIELTGKKVLVAGGGEIAARRVKTLLNFGADIYLVSPKLTPELQEMLNRKLFNYREGYYEQLDIQNKFLAVAATDDRETNHKVYLDAKEQGIQMSIADCREECSFYFPAIFEFDGIVGGLVSKNGDNHSLVRTVAERIRQIGQAMY
ncbi:precorrin-6A reductase [Clostridium sp. BNL1100]|uniref:precorrin-6A reductase n=1 Tax=Clostridium sp. BNL1100 TaxID=755731 RepID=UPI00024A77CC|nr:precorrin-6A reductase [Clostridium sp. BNL1100]AEY65212.1 precorrin-6x reductase [Clostridium sp. BNL1100]